MADLVLVALGAGLVYLAWWIKQRADAYFARAETARAEILRVEITPGRDLEADLAELRREGREARAEARTRQLRNKNVFLQVRFTDRNAAPQEQRTRTGVKYGEVRGLREIEVFYDPQDPADVRIGKSTDTSLWKFVGAIGLVIAGFGIYGLFA